MFRILLAPPFRLVIRFAAVWAVLGFSMGSKSANGAEWLYVSMEDDTIRRYDISLGTSGTVAGSEQIFVNSGQGLFNPWGLAFDSSGKLYAANYGNNTISKIDNTGTILFSWSTPAIPHFMVIVPEPSAWILGGLAMGLMALLARRRRVKGLA